MITHGEKHCSCIRNVVLERGIQKHFNLRDVSVQIISQIVYSIMGYSSGVDITAPDFRRCFKNSVQYILLCYLSTFRLLIRLIQLNRSNNQMYILPLKFKHFILNRLILHHSTLHGPIRERFSCKNVVPNTLYMCR